MKRVLFATVAVAVWPGGMCLVPRQAVAIVCSNCTQEGGEIIREFKRAAEVVKQIGLLRDQYTQAVRTYETLRHPNRVLGIAKGMLDQQMRSPGSAPGNIPGLSFGSQLGEGARRFLDRNRQAEIQGDDFAAQEMRRREQATANIQAEAQAGIERAEERIAHLDELQASIEGQEDITAIAAVEARLSSEKLFLQNEANNIARLQLVQATAGRVDAQRAEQNARVQAEDWGRRAAAQAFDLGGLERSP